MPIDAGLNMNFLSLIESKRDGQTLTTEQIRSLVQGCTTGDIPDYQLAAFLMAVYFRGLDAEETRTLTLAMRDSGERLSFPQDPRPLADKHSTGGVGDKVSLPLAPLLACLGFRVPMISGRGLGITGGTLDKLESIPGFRTALPATKIVEIVQRTGCVICGQTERMVPADKRLYALRDVTGTVPSIQLIVASILSKKLAESIGALVLDVKFGAGAFMPEIEQARELGRAMVTLGNACGVRTRALLTTMHSPLGRAAGNWLEVREAVACLEPGAAPGTEDVRELVLACAATLLVESGKVDTLEFGTDLASDCLASGEPRQKFDQMLAAQGADLDAFRRKLRQDATAPAVREVKADSTGWVGSCDARAVGEIVRDLGGGRLTQEAVIEPEVGVDRMLKPGEGVTTNSTLARVHARTSNEAEAASKRLRGAFTIVQTHSDVPPQSLICDQI